MKFMGMNNFSWWFGVVENRIDPLELGRCQVRCFGWHTEKTNQIPKEDLPWAHPVLPVGTTSVKSPAEGTMVFGFFADGEEGRFPVMLGIVPSIPDLESVREPQEGFSDPFTADEKSTNPFFPRKVEYSRVTANASGPQITNSSPQRFPENTDEPTTSRLTRPDRVSSETTNASIGVRSPSIANTSIDYQRRNRIVGVKSASGYSWNEPFPSFNADFPFNNVTETESGHAFELDDTPNWERVQLSHRTGSTLEFLPSGSIKQKAFNNKYDVTMGNHREYTAGNHDQTVQGSMFLRINGKLVIECDGFDLVSSGDVNIKGKNVKITSGGNMDLYAGAVNKVYGAAGADIRTEGNLYTYGGAGADHSSGGVTVLSGVPNPISAAIKTALADTLKSIGLDKSAQNITDHIPTVFNSGVKVIGPNFWMSTALVNMNSLVTNILPPSTSPDPSSSGSASRASRWRRSVPKLTPTNAPPLRERTDIASFENLRKIRLIDSKIVDDIVENETPIEEAINKVEEEITREAESNERPQEPTDTTPDPATATPTGT